MLDFHDARRLVLAAGGLLATEELAVADALDRVLIEDLAAHQSMPAFSYSAMDGYAVTVRDLRGQAPYELPVIGEARAGGAALRLERGSAIRIFTGAELPEEADSVVIQEDTTLFEGGVRIHVPVEPFQNVRRAGEDLDQGAVALTRGTRLGPFQLGLVAALDRPTVRVARRPRVAVLSTGDELRLPGAPPRRGSVPDSNSVAIRALIARAGGECVLHAHASDDETAVARLIKEAAERTDVLVTIGGVSVGTHDVVRNALAGAGARLDFWKVAIRPGKPFTFGAIGGTRVLGLPGNPVSAQVTFALFGVPLLRSLQGDHSPLPRMERVVVTSALRQKPGRLGVYRAMLEGRHASVHGNQASGSTVSLAHADALVLLPADVAESAAGAELDAIRLRDL